MHAVQTSSEILYIQKPKLSKCWSNRILGDKTENKINWYKIKVSSAAQINNEKVTKNIQKIYKKIMTHRGFKIHKNLRKQRWSL